MADRQRSFADMFPDVLGSLTRGAEWKEAMRPRTKKEMARQLTQEDRKWLKEREQQGWLDRRLNLLGPQDPSIASQVLDYASMWPGNIARKGVQTGIWDMVPDKIKKRIKRQMKEESEIRPGAEVLSGDKMGMIPAVDKRGYNTDFWRKGKSRLDDPRTAADHSMDLAGRFLEYLRDSDNKKLNDVRDQARDALSAVDQDEIGIIRTPEDWDRIEGRRRDPERIAQAEAARQARFRSINESISKTLDSPSSFNKLSDLVGRTFGRRKSYDP